MESKDVKKVGSWHDYYQANTRRWADPEKPFISVGVIPVRDYVYDAQGQRTDKVRSLGYWVAQVVTSTGESNNENDTTSTGDSSSNEHIVRYTNPVLVRVDGGEELSLQMGDLVMFDGLASYYVKGFKHNNMLYRGHVNFRADRIRRVEEE